MAGDFARWLAAETAAVLTHDTPGDPFSRIPSLDDCEYAGTPLELPGEHPPAGCCGHTGYGCSCGPACRCGCPACPACPALNVRPAEPS